MVGAQRRAAYRGLGRLPSAPDREPVRAPRSGYVAEIRAGNVGHATVTLGAGRARLDDVVDHGVGVEVLVPRGTQVGEGEPVLMVHHRSGRGLDDARPLLIAAVVISDDPPAPRPLVLERVTD